VSRERKHPNEENGSAEELAVAANCADSEREKLRLLAVRALQLGHEFCDVREIFDVSDRTLENWINEFNEQGIDGLIDRPRSGRPRIIGEERAEELTALLNNPNLADEHFWTGKKFHGYLVNELKEEIAYSSTIRFLHEQGFSLQVPRPKSPNQDEMLRKAYLERLLELQKDPDVEIWYLDECGVEGDPRPRRRWAPKNSKQTIPYTGNHIRMNICGMVCPATGEFLCLEFDYMDTDAFQIFLDFADEKLRKRKKTQVVICDNASWHKASRLKWGNNMTPAFLPPYSPDFNPIERLWLRLKADYFQDFIAKDHPQLLLRLEVALSQLMQDRRVIKSICRDKVL
jgi:transposase